MNFTIVKSVTIPEGVVKKITDAAGNVLWNASTPTAILYSDGTLVFQNDSTVDEAHGTVVNMYTGWDTDTYSSSSKVPWYAERANIINVFFKDNVAPLNMAYWFYYCNNLTLFDPNNLDTSNVMSMRDLFNGCSKITTLNLSNFNTSNVTTMANMFSQCYALENLDVSNFNTSKVTNMYGMFQSCKVLTELNLSNFNTGNIINDGMVYMFNQCHKLNNLILGSMFTTSKITSMLGMFRECKVITELDLSNFDTSKVTSMNYMFYSCDSLTSLDLSNFVTSKVINMGYMFSGCDSLTSLDLSNFDTSKVTAKNSMFSNCNTSGFTIYVANDDMVTWVQSTSNFPSTATVVVGSMN